MAPANENGATDEGEKKGDKGKEIKTDRSKSKRPVTKQMNYIKQLMAEGNIDVIEKEIDRLKVIFEEFGVKHEKYVELVDDDNELDECDVYFTSVQDSYIETLNLVKDINIDVRVKSSGLSSPSESGSNKMSDLTREELVNLMSLPKLSIGVFYGNPRKYHSLMTIFDITVD